MLLAWSWLEEGLALDIERTESKFSVKVLNIFEENFEDNCYIIKFSLTLAQSWSK